MLQTRSKNNAIDVELRHVSKFFGAFTAVDNVTFAITQGEFFSLLGPSGCGKSTTLRMIAGFEFPDQGEVLIGGEVMGNRPAYLRQTNMVFQNLALFPHMNVFDNIAFGLVMKKKSRDEILSRVKEALQLVRLEGYEKRRIDQLSGGQQQRVAIARAIVNQPRVLLLDEPLGALDLKLRLQMQMELKRIQAELGTTFIYVTHDQSEALTMSDRIAVMDQGHIAQIGTPREIYERPRTKFVANFIGDTNLLEGIVDAQGPETTTLQIGLLNCTVSGGGQQEGKGAQVSFSVRHERVKVGASLEGLDNIYPATVNNLVFIGSMVKYYLLLPNKLEIISQAVNDGNNKIFNRGDELQVGWNAEDAIIVS